MEKIIQFFLQPRIQCSRCKKNKLASKVREMRNQETGDIEMVCYDCKPQSSRGSYSGGDSQTYEINDINP